MNRGTTCYTDNAYYLAEPFDPGTQELEYDVRCYYQPTNSYALPWWQNCSGSTFLPQRAEGTDAALDTKVPSEYGFSALPNPFNPSVQLNYQLKENSSVRILIHDMLGRLVTELVNADQSTGRYSCEWNATDKASGIYFASFVVSSAGGKPFVETKKLVLAK